MTPIVATMSRNVIGQRETSWAGQFFNFVVDEVTSAKLVIGLNPRPVTLSSDGYLILKADLV